MSAIAGFCNPKDDFTSASDKWNHILLNMNRIQKHRGPDSDGIFLDMHCGLAHARLATIDLATGRQPLSRTEGERTCTISCNGEIYNMHALKKELASEGVQFQTESDTEVILAGYMLHGINYVNKLVGVFAFALWDSRLCKIFLLRDRLGVKPLFYTLKENSLIFSSEIKGLFQYPDIEPVIDRDGLCEIFGLGPAKTYGKGVFKDILEVLPGYYLEFSENELKQYRYWQLESKPHEDSYSETVEKTSALVYDAIKSQMLSDIPICTFLSGGVDSSLITAICASEMKKQGQILNTFSFDFKENSKHFKSNDFQPSEDRPWVEKMVAYSGTNHRYLECDNNELIGYLYKAVDARDLPCMADVESSMLYFCSEVTKYNKVALSGECADEIFGGYPWFHREDMLNANGFPWSMDLEARKVLLQDELTSKLRIEEYVNAAYEKTIGETPLLEGETGLEQKRRKIAYLNLKWFMITLLDRADRTSMASGLCTRVPLADHRILEYVWNVPWEMKCPDGLVKGLLRAAVEDYLPREVLYRKKSPYPKTYNPEYANLLGEQLKEVMNDSNAPIREFVDQKKLELFLKSPHDYGKPWYGQLMAGPQMLAFMLQVNYWLEEYGVYVEL